MYQRVLIFLFCFVPLHATESEVSLFDEYHGNLCQVLLDTSNEIDNYFFEGNKTNSSKTYAEVISSVAYETKKLGFESDFRVRLRLDLPKIKQNVRLVFEDESSDNLLYDGTSLENQQLKEKEYYLRLEYFNYIQEQFKLRFGAGVKIRERNFVPYLNSRLQYHVLNQQTKKMEFFNRFRYYSDGEVENNFEFNTLLMLKNNFYLINRNNYYYTNRNDFQILANDVTLLHHLNTKQQLSYGLGLSTHLEGFQSPLVEYYHLHSTWHHRFYKNILYYEIVPSILQRRINNFQTSYRLLLNFGVYFNKYY